MSTEKEPEVISEDQKSKDQNESENRYTGYSGGSVEDAIYHNFTAEQKRKWTEFIVSNEDQLGEETVSTPQLSKDKKESISSVSDKINKNFSKEQRKSFAELVLASDIDKDQTNQSSTDESSQNLSQAKEKQSKETEENDSDTDDESLKRYTDYSGCSVEDAICHNFTAEQKKKWTEFIVSNEDQLGEETVSTPQLSKDKKESISSVSDKINKNFSKEQRKNFAELALASDKDKDQTNQSSTDESSQNLSQAKDKKQSEETEENDSDTDDESLKRYSDYKVKSVDNILHHFTPEQRKNLTESVFASEDQSSEDSRKESPLSQQSENKYKSKKSVLMEGGNNRREYYQTENQNFSEVLIKHNLVIGSLIAHSTFGYVVYGSYLQNNQIALKIIDLKHSNDRGFDGNSFAMKQLKDRNIVEVFDLIKENNLLFVVMPLAQTDLFQHITNEGVPNEGKGKEMIYQILHGLQFIHNKGWAHRDIKLENCLLFGFRIKICDFDLMKSAVDNKGNPVADKEQVGTLVYMSPELLSGKGSPDLRMSDLWSCGNLSFALLTYSYAFRPIEDIYESEKVLEDMRYKQYSYPKECFLSQECKSFIHKLLEFDPFSRPTLNQLFSDKWFSI